MNNFGRLSNIATRRHVSQTVESKPYTFKWGLIPVTVVSIPMIYFGAMVAKRGAAFLEEWNIFVPDDEDDD